MSSVEVIYSKKKFDADHLLGQYIDESHYDLLITSDTDVYAPSIDGSMNEENIVLKFRKNVFSKEEQDMIYSGLKDAAGETQNRGKAAGPRGTVLSMKGRTGREWVTSYQLTVLDYLCRTNDGFLETETLEDIKRKYSKQKIDEEETRGFVWLRSKVSEEHDPYFGWFDRWLNRIGNLPREQQKEEAEHIRNEFISTTNYAKSVKSGVAGYFSRYPRIPYGRATAFTEQNLESFKKSYPFLHKLDQSFSELLPERWSKQRKAADELDPKFLIDDTVFTTLTVNHNFRTAAHLDAGDLGRGFSNLSVVGNGWEGGELILPEYRAAVDLRPGDLLLVANHTAIHGNNEISGESPDRLSIVAYFREDMLECGSWEYEQLRKQYIDERRKNPNHRLARNQWNGVSPGMWVEDEWKNYLKVHNIEDHDGLVNESQTLEKFFG